MSAKRTRSDGLTAESQSEKCMKVDKLMERRVNPLKITAACKEADVARATYDRSTFIFHTLFSVLKFNGSR